MQARVSLRECSGGEHGQQVTDAGVNLPDDAGEGRMVVLVGIASGGRVGDAPVDQPGIVADVGADLADLVAQGDQVAEPAVGHRVQVSWPLVGDVDAELLAQHPGRMRVDALLGVAAGACHVDVATGAVAEQGFSDR